MTADPFVVQVAGLRRATGNHQRVRRSGPVDPYEGSNPPTAADSVVAPGSELACDAMLEAIPGGVMATGTVVVPWQGVCRRCTAEVTGTLEVSVRERFMERPEPGDDEAYPLDDDHLDLRPLVHDAVVLELPANPLCREECAGLCPHCGADRNLEACDCVTPADPRWASLDVLRSDAAGQPASRAGDRS